MMRSGTTYQLGSWDAHMGASASGLLPTPTASDNRDASLKRSSLERQARAFHNPKYKSVKRTTMAYAAIFNEPMPAEFCEWMMLFPIGWTDLKPSATP